MNIGAIADPPQLWNKRRNMATPILDLNERRGMDKQKALESALAQIERSFGKGSIMKLGSTPTLDIAAISTGSIGLDIALGIGGLPKGRIVEIYGPESSGKTTLALHVLAEEQKNGGVVAFVDAEHALDPVYAKKLGVNIDELLISQPDYRRAGPRDHRDAGAFRRSLGRCGRQRRGADPQIGARGRHGRRARSAPRPG